VKCFEKTNGVARAAGAEVPFMRPASLASPDAVKFQVWQHALQPCKEQDGIANDLYIDIDCTNPLLQVADIQGVLQKFRQLRQDGLAPDAVFTVSEAQRNPYLNLVETDNDGIMKMSKSIGNGTVLARQQAPAVYEHIAGTIILTTK